MGGFFTKSKKPLSRVTEQDKAVLQLKQQRDKLKQYQKKIELNLEKQRQLAKKFLAEDKRDKAKLLLKKKRYLENLLQNADIQLEKLEQLTHDLEFTQIEVQVLDGLKNGNAALKTIHEMMSFDEVERIMDETREGIEKQREFDELISGQLTEEDNDAITAELEEMLDIKDLPEVPIDELAESEETREEEKTKKTKSGPKKIALES